MATNNFTVSDGATDSELAERFPPNCTPFAIWFNPEADGAKWGANDETGFSIVDAPSYEAAVKIASALKYSQFKDASIKATPEQIAIALDQIAHMAAAIGELCTIAGEGDPGGYMRYAARHLAEKIGWTADRCLGFDIQESDNWLLPPAWEREPATATATA